MRSMSSGPIPYLNGFGITMMSFLRYHISNRIVNCQSTRKTSTYATTLLVLFMIQEWVFCGPLAFVSAQFFDIPTGAASCAGASLTGKSILGMVRLAKGFIIVFVGMTYDYLMIGFLRKRNATKEPGQAKLVPWKSGDQEYDFMVPISATITSALSGILGFVILVINVKARQDDVLEVWKYNSFIFSMLCSIQMPIMIGLTIRAAKHKKPAPVIPKGPQFHEPASDVGNDAIDISENQVHELEDRNHAQDVEDVSLAVFQPIRSNVIHVKPIINDECHI